MQKRATNTKSKVEEKMTNASYLAMNKVILGLRVHHDPLYVYNLNLNTLEGILSYEEKDIGFDIFDPYGPAWEEFLGRMRDQCVSAILERVVTIHSLGSLLKLPARTQIL